MNLFDAANGSRMVIRRLNGSPMLRKRLLEMGFVKGSAVSIVRKAPLQDPIEIAIKGFHVSLRASEAKAVEVEPEV